MFGLVLILRWFCARRDSKNITFISKNKGGICDLPDDDVVQFMARIARPHIFMLRISDGIDTDSETTIVAVNNGDAGPVLSPPPVEENCLH